MPRASLTSPVRSRPIEADEVRVLLAGTSTRAMAHSAAAAGYAVTSVDAFGDSDQPPGTRVVRVSGTLTAMAAARAASRLDADAVAYGGPFENDARAVGLLSKGRRLLGNPGSVLGRVRDPFAACDTLDRRGLNPARVWPEHTPPPLGRKRWLVKPRASGGGRAVRRWEGGRRPGTAFYLQERVSGTPGSVVFASAHGIAVPLAVSTILCGERAFGASGYQYCGNITAAEDDRAWLGGRRLLARLSRLANAIANAFDLVGVNGVDFVVERSVPRTIEINPRWCASMELPEWVYGLSVFRAHAAASGEGVLPEFDLARARRGAGAVGKAVLYAREPVVIGETGVWLDRARAAGFGVRDIPRTGECIAAGRPVCTVLARAKTGDTCHRALRAAAASVYDTLKPWTKRAR